MSPRSFEFPAVRKCRFWYISNTHNVQHSRQLPTDTDPHLTRNSATYSQDVLKMFCNGQIPTLKKILKHVGIREKFLNLYKPVFSRFAAIIQMRSVPISDQTLQEQYNDI